MSDTFVEDFCGTTSIVDSLIGVTTEVQTKEEFRSKVQDFQKVLESTPAELQVVNPLVHQFAEGMYIREINCEAGQIIVTKIHKQKHPYFLLEGDLSILTEEGVVRVKAPHYAITEPGTKRVIYVHEKCRFITVQRTDKTDLDEIEDEVIAKDFSDPALLEQEMKTYLGAAE